MIHCKKLLAFDTSGQQLSIALRTAHALFEFSADGGAQASQHMIGAICAQMQRAGLTFSELDAIAFGAGPGAFTGLRASCAVAQGLGFAARVPLMPISTLHAVALARYRQSCHQGQPTPSVLAAIDARMGEAYWQRFDFSQQTLGVPVGEPQLSRVQAQHFEFDLGPSASLILELAAHALAHDPGVDAIDALPVYVRNNVALTTAQRQAQAQESTP